MLVARRQGADRRRGWRDDRYKFVCGDQRYASAGRGAVPAGMSVEPFFVEYQIIEVLLKGLLQGGEFVTVRAKEMASGKFDIVRLLRLSFNHNQKN